MGPYLLTNSALIGLFGFAAMYHLALWWAGRRDGLLLAFAARCTVLSAYGVVFVNLATAQDVETLRTYDALRSVMLALGIPAAAWTLSLVAGRRGLPYVWPVTVLFVGAALAAALGQPFVGEPIGLERLTLPWGEVVSVPVRGAAPAWGLPVYIMGSSVDVFAAWCAAVLWRRDRVGGSLLGLAALGGLVTDVAAARLDVMGLRGFYIGSLNNALWVLLLALITARVQRQRDHDADELAGRQRERQQELEQQLEQSQRLEAIGRLAGGIAHDFNNLLMVVNGHAERLLGLLQDPEARREAQLIREAGDRASGLTRQLLAFSRQSVVEATVVSLNEAVLAAQAVLRRVIGEDITLVVKTCPAEPCIVSSVTQIGQVLLNLAANARDAMPGGGRLLIAVECPPRDDGAPGQWAILRVSDTGAGMSADVQAHIFEPFFTTKGTARGTGLGLSVVHGIVTQAGGRVEVESIPDFGTTFTLYLPTVAERPGEAPDPAAAPMAGGRESVLLVEDDSEVREVVAGMLAGLGYQVVEAGDGPAAMRAAAAAPAPFDLLVSDVLMPGQTGPDLAQQLRARNPRLAVLFISGYAPDSVPLPDLVRDAQLLAKPFSAPALAARVREALDAR